MRDAVERLYAVFQSYGPPTHILDVCTRCCVTPEVEACMRRTPLRGLTAQQFFEYNCSAKSAKQPVDEIKYLLPRLMELVAKGAEVHHSTELQLQRLGNSDAAAFSEVERAAIDAFALAYFSDFLARHPWMSLEGASLDGALELLLMFDYGGIALEPLLERWLQNDCVAATLHYADASYWDFGTAMKFKNAFASDRETYCETLKSWLLRPENRRLFANRILRVDVAALKESGNASVGYGMTQKDLLEAVFDSITE